MIFGGNVKNIYKFHVQPINPRHPEMYLHHYMCGRSCFASLAPKHGSSVHVLAVGELFRNHGVELVLRHLRRNCQCLHLKQALTRTAIQSLHTLAAFGRRATNHVMYDQTRNKTSPSSHNKGYVFTIYSKTCGAFACACCH